MNVMSRIFGDVTAAVSGDTGAFDAVRLANADSTNLFDAANNPMSEVLNGLRQTQKSGQLTVGMIFDKAQVLGIPPEAWSNLRGQDLSGVTFSQADMNRAPGDLDLRGADITGSVFHPASSFEGVLIDEVTVGASTQTQHVTFDGFDHKANLELSKGDWSYFNVAGDDASEANHANITVGNGVTALGADLSGSRFSVLSGSNADLSGLDASNALALRTDVTGGRLNGADFSGARFAPGSRMQADLIGANFENAVLGDLNLSGSRLVGANLEGADLTHVNLDGAILIPEDLEGAVYRETDEAGKSVGEPMTITAANVDQFLASRTEAGQTPKVQSAYTAISTMVGDKIIQGPGAVAGVMKAVGEIRATRDAGPALSQQKGQAPVAPMDKTDGLINALCQVNAEMANGGIFRTLGGDEHNIGQQHQSAVHQRDHDLGIEHGT